jgi:hypothetical protein
MTSSRTMLKMKAIAVLRGSGGGAAFCMARKM